MAGPAAKRLEPHADSGSVPMIIVLREQASPTSLPEMVLRQLWLHAEVRQILDPVETYELRRQQAESQRRDVNEEVMEPAQVERISRLWLGDDTDSSWPRSRDRPARRTGRSGRPVGSCRRSTTPGRPRTFRSSAPQMAGS